MTAITRPMPRRSTGSKAKAASPSAMPTRSTARRASIAGILNEAGNVLGMMPHPERVVEAAHGGTDGRRLFEGLLEAVGLSARAALCQIGASPTGDVVASAAVVTTSCLCASAPR